MIRFIKNIIILSLLLGTSYAQTDLFDCKHSEKFAEYLFNTGQYDLAQHEIERIKFFCETDDNIELILLKSYRKTKSFEKANNYFNSKYQKSIPKLADNYKSEYIRLLMSQQLYGQVQKLIHQDFDFKEKYEYRLGTNILMENWDEAYRISKETVPETNFKISGLQNVAKRGYTAKRKDPLLATILSVIVPGSGKMYAGYWGDGVISFLFTASSGFFAYRAFSKYGSDKVYPWLAGGLAISYYAGNIYGGNRAAIRYNDNLNHGFIHETEAILYTDY